MSAEAWGKYRTGGAGGLPTRASENTGGQATRATRRCGLTMVELLVTMSIVAMLASMVLMAMGTAQESARVARTETLIATLHGIVMQHYDGYRTRRVPINTSNMNPQAAAQQRLNAIRVLMMHEMPDHWNDVNPMPSSSIYQTGLVRAFNRQATASSGNSEYISHQGAECLYLLVTYGNPDARSMFRESDIGDVDGDGAPEFLDGWGNPIAFLRWPAGFSSALQTGKADTDHDPFDPLLTDGDAYRLVPLIYSAGPDGEYNILVAPPESKPSFSYSATAPDPYAVLWSGGRKMGDLADTASNGHIDNIHNHLIGTK